MGRLDGKTAIITGAARGQGEAEARLFTREGAAVVICDILDEAGAALAAELTAAGHQARYLHLDVSDEAGWKLVVAETLAWRGRIDILVNNAGINDRGSVSSVSMEAWHRTLGVNLTGPFNGMRAVAEIMRDGGGGAIVNIASMAGFMGTLGAAYTASKWGLRGLTRIAALEYVDWNIRVNTVCPGLIVTALNAEMAYLDPFKRMTPMGRAGTVDEVAKTVLFLASDDASYITGEDIAVDGGFLAGAAARRVALDSGIDMHKGVPSS